MSEVLSERNKIISLINRKRKLEVNIEMINLEIEHASLYWKVGEDGVLRMRGKISDGRT